MLLVRFIEYRKPNNGRKDVIAAGFFVTATPTINSDLYWAMLGGEGGTFGIVTLAVVKVHPKVSVTTSVFNFTTSATVSNETF